jgi:hypothetical protein
MYDLARTLQNLCDNRCKNIPLFIHRILTTFHQQRPTFHSSKSLWWNIGLFATRLHNPFRTPRLRQRPEMPENIPLYERNLGRWSYLFPGRGQLKRDSSAAQRLSRTRLHARSRGQTHLASPLLHPSRIVASRSAHLRSEGARCSGRLTKGWGICLADWGSRNRGN